MIYWNIRTRHPGGTSTYFKTDRKYIPEMVVDMAVRQKMFLDVFVQEIESVTEVTKEEYFEHMWE